MWHASLAPVIQWSIPPEQLAIFAGLTLTGVGDASLGEWHEWTGYAYHVRRRLRPEEEAIVGPAIDCRGTEEAARRFFAIQRELPSRAISLAAEELSGRIPPCK